MKTSIAMLTICLSAAGAAGLQADEEPQRSLAADLAPPVPIMAADEPLEVEGFAAPFLGDFDGDGVKDLLVGQFHLGRLRIYRNTGTNARPAFDSFQWFTADGRIAGVRVCCQVAFTPQLTDFDGDGRTDILTGSGIAGEAFVFRRRADQTFAGAQVLENRHGQVLLHRWSSSGRPSTRRYNVTAWAYDWDDDGDADLLMGTHPVCLVLNQGTAEEPSFDGGRLVKCNGQPILGGLASPQMADWDGDGLDDLLCGDRRDIVWYRNVGKQGRPEFEAPRLLVSNSTSNATTDVPEGQPGLFHAFSAADFNADGRLDLLLGDRRMERVEISDEDRQRILANVDRRDALRDEYNDLSDEPDVETRPERIERYRKALAVWQEYETLRQAGSPSSKSRYERRGRVWFYERIGVGARIP